MPLNPDYRKVQMFDGFDCSVGGRGRDAESFTDGVESLMVIAVHSQLSAEEL